MPARGSEDLIEAVRMTTGISRGFIPSEGQITITTGANSAILCIKVSCQPRRRGTPQSLFPIILSGSRNSRITTRYYKLSADNNFNPCINSLKAAITPKTKAILINSPSNPTGTVFSMETIKEIYEVALTNDLYKQGMRCMRMIYKPDKVFFCWIFRPLH